MLTHEQEGQLLAIKYAVLRRIDTQRHHLYLRLTKWASRLNTKAWEHLAGRRARHDRQLLAWLRDELELELGGFKGFSITDVDHPDLVKLVQLLQNERISNRLVDEEVLGAGR